MKKKMIEIMDKFHQYNSDNMAYLAFGLDRNEHYDALVVAPSYSPYKLKMESYCKVTTLKEGAYIAGYLVEKGDLKIAWIKTSSSDSNLIDHVAVCAELTFDKMIFIGAVGALKPEFELGDLCTPSIATEYYHLEEIKEFDTDLIEMETASLYLMADLLEIPTVAILVVSDNSATGVALVGRTDEEQEKYNYGRNVVLPAMILKIADVK